jgi:hypothetical protein
MPRRFKHDRFVKENLAIRDMLDAGRSELMRSSHFPLMSFSRQNASRSSETIPESSHSPIKAHAKFSPEEDQQLKSLVDLHGSKDWRMIAEQLGTKNPRQCKERWLNYLNPGLSMAQWTIEEELLLLEKYRELGPRWVTITKFFPNRTDAMLKNRFNRIQRWGRRTRQILCHEELGFLLGLPNPMCASAPEPCFPTMDRPRFDDLEPAPLHDEEEIEAWSDLCTIADDLPYF